MSALVTPARIMPVSEKITQAHTAKHARQARPWCPLCAGLTPSTPAPAPKPAPARTRKPAPAQAPTVAPASGPGAQVTPLVADSARIVLDFLAQIDLDPSVDLLRALAKAGTRGPAPRRAPRPQAGHVPPADPRTRYAETAPKAPKAPKAQVAQVPVPAHVWVCDIPVAA